MKHVEVSAYGCPPCGGLVRPVPRDPPSGGERPAGAPRSLPIIGGGARPAQAPRAWRCERCGKSWDREPLPDEAL